MMYRYISLAATYLLGFAKATNFAVNINRHVHAGLSRHHLGSTAGTTIDLVSKKNVAYTGPVFFGTPLQGSNSSVFLYDSGSGYLMVTESGCTTCTTQYLNTTKSQSQANSTTYTATAIGYGSAKFAGYMASDLVCLSDYNSGSTCVNGFDFFVTTKQSGMISGVDGILGLGPPVKSNGPSYVQNLFLGGVIDAPIVSF